MPATVCVYDLFPFGSINSTLSSECTAQEPAAAGGGVTVSRDGR